MGPENTEPDLDSLTLVEFLALLERSASAETDSPIMEVVRILAKAVPSDRRMAVVEALPDGADPTEPELSLRPSVRLPDIDHGSALVNETEAFVRRLEDGRYFESIRWDEERHEERAWGDDSWAGDMDDLFGKAATAYLAGGHQLAARVYGRLLNAFRLADRPGVFCGPEVPARMVQTELSDAKRRYFRSLYIVLAPEDRAARLLSEMEGLRNIGESAVGLRSMTETETDADPALTDLESFLPDWIILLKSVRQDPRGWGREARRLLREAVEMHGGADGLGKLARETGADHPEAYHDWVGMLVRLDRGPEAVRAAREGVDRIRDSAYRARLADRLALLASAEGEVDLAVDATRNAWRTSPTEVRLLHLVAAAEAADMREAILMREASVVLRSDWNHSDALACRVLLLVGRHEEAATRFERADAPGWGRADHAGSVVLPFLLLASTELPKPPRGSAIEALWSNLDETGANYFDRRLLLDRMAAGEDAVKLFARERAYSDLLREAVALHPIPDVYRPRMLAIAQMKVESVVRDILHGQHRRGQALASRLTIALAEAIAIAQKREDGLQFLRGMREEYRRYRGFVEFLADGRTASPILPDPTPDTKRPTLELVES